MKTFETSVYGPFRRAPGDRARRVASAAARAARRGVFLGALLAMLSGCFGGGYPPQWAPVEGASGGCAALAGVYANIGEFSDPGLEARVAPAYRPHLAAVFGLVARDADRVKVSYDAAAETLTVEAVENGKAVASHAFTRTEGTLSCTASGAEFRTKTEVPTRAGTPLLGVATTSRVLKKSGDGSLVQKASSTIAGMVFLVLPVVANDTTWVRWRPVR